MEVLKLDIVGSYYYKPDIEIITYESESNTQTQTQTHCKECVICKKSLFEPSYEMISNNSNIINENNVSIGKCGHIFHEDCLNIWLKNNDTCPIDNIKWCLHRVADTTTKLVLYNDNTCLPSFTKNKFIKDSNGNPKKVYNNKR